MAFAPPLPKAPPDPHSAMFALAHTVAAAAKIAQESSDVFEAWTKLVIELSATFGREMAYLEQETAKSLGTEVAKLSEQQAVTTHGDIAMYG